MHTRAKTRMLRKFSWRRLFAGLGLAAGLILGLSAPAAYAQNAQVTGTVVDAKSGEPMVGATVMLENTATGAKTNLSGKFIMKNVTFGVYTVVVTSVGYSPTKVEGVEVQKGGADLTITLTEKPIESQKTVVVRAKANQSTDAALLRDRQAATAVKDAISAQAISRSGSGTAAQAISRVTGASTDGKYVFIRGLGDRYTNTQLNGTMVPTPDPDKQAVPLDLIPSDLLDNIVVTKSFTADMPGNFSGGSVNLVTKDFPERRTAKFTMGTSYNSMATFKDALNGTSGTTDWLGKDDGGRAMPSFFNDPANLDRMPQGNTIIKDSAEAVFLKQASQSFNTKWSPGRTSIPLNQNYGFQYGDNVTLFGRSLGMVGSLAYNRSSRFYDNGNYQFSVARSVTDLEIIDQYTDARSVDEVLWGSLAGLSYSLGTRHTVGASYVYNRSGESEARFLKGRNYENGTEGEWRESRVLSYTERNIGTLQVKGGHQVSIGAPLRIEWLVGNSHARQQQPDLRQFLSSVRIDDSNYPDVDTVWSTGSGYRWPSRYWRDLKETNQEYALNLTFQATSSMKLKTGGSYLKKDRTNRQTQFNLTGDPAVLTAVHGDPDAFADTAGYYVKYGRSTYVFPVYYVNGTQLRDQYDGVQEIGAAYLMAETPVLSHLTLTAGVRREATRMQTKTFDPSRPGGRIEGDDWLPSVNLVYALTPTMNLRGAYGRTLARPTLREIAPFGTEEFAGARLFVGNDSMTYTTIDNYDLRWEWFVNPGEIVAVSAFYKRFVDPIELSFFSSNYDIRPVNAPQAKNYGMEFEIRRRLDFAAGWLRDFALGANLSLIRSQLRIPEKEYSQMKGVDPEASDTRPMANQSPYLINVTLAYTNPRTGTSADLLYNVSGRRFYVNSQGGAPDIYEKPRHTVDMIASQTLWRGITVKASVKNLLNSRFEAVYYYTGTGKENPYKSYDLGRTVSISLSYAIL